MTMTTTQHVSSYIAMGMVLIVSAVGCTTVRENPALEQARMAYSQAQQNPQIATHAPVALRDAEQALQQAEQVWARHKDEQEVQYLSYVAERKVEIARAAAEQKMAEAEVQELGKEREQVLLDSRAREANRARQEAHEATTRATQLERELSELKAKETDRGLVLTLGDVLFEFNKADLKPGGMRNLYQLVDFLKKNPTRNVSIEGHTDNIGSEGYNLELSQRRAETVRAFLLDNGISPERVTARGYGTAYPIATNNTEAGRQQNRRVEVVVLR
jgi:outer membrane protein OmpA-like peptidoglycan-associated protein